MPLVEFFQSLFILWLESLDRDVLVRHGFDVEFEEDIDNSSDFGSELVFLWPPRFEFASAKANLHGHPRFSIFSISRLKLTEKKLIVYLSRTNLSVRQNCDQLDRKRPPSRSISFLVVGTFRIG